ncbi:MAG: hypothetical protein LLG04_11185, partial [Parachlamydia sp.]|nr:hypothetical protein [Parachlamydia sp.]
GTYVIAGNSGALSEIVTSQRGLLVCLDDRNSLVDTLDHLLLHPPARSEHTPIYDWSKLFQRYEAFMESCA